MKKDKDKVEIKDSGNVEQPSNDQTEARDDGKTGNASKDSSKKFRLFKKKPTFYKKKPLYIVLVTVLSILLVLDLLILVLVPNTSGMMSMMNGMGTDTTFELSEDTDSSSGDGTTDDTADGFDSASLPDSGEMGELPSDGTMPDMDGSFDASGDTDASADASEDADTEASGDSETEESDSSEAEDASDSESASDDSDFDGGTAFGGTMPGGSDDSTMPGGDMSGQTGELPDGTTDGTTDSATDGTTDGSEETTGDDTGETTDTAADITGASGWLRGFAALTWIRARALPIAIVLAVLDIASIVMLIIVSKKQKKARKEELKAQAEEEGRIYIERKPVKKHRNSIASGLIPVVIILVIVLLVQFISTSNTTIEIEQTEASDLSGTAEVTSIDTVVPGTGTLVEEDAEEMSYVDGIEVSTWYVSNGDTVSEGDVLAKLDLISVMSAIVEVQEQLDALDEEIASHEDDALDDAITVTSDARVKVIYAEEGTAVTDTMYEYGALMILSLDGLMAVEITTDVLTAGDSVTVVLSDDTEVEGKVASLVNQTATITIDDEDIEIGESVTVYSEDGDELGSGELYIHSELEVTGYSGTVESIEVSEEEEVESGDTLITLTDTDYTAEYDALITQRTELQEQMQTLFKLYSEGYIYASCDGVISGISSSDSSTSSTEDADADTADEEDTDSDDDTSGDSSDDATASSAVIVTGDGTAVAALSTDVFSLTVSTEETGTDDVETSGDSSTEEDPEDDAESGDEIDTDAGESSEETTVEDTTAGETTSEDASTAAAAEIVGTVQSFTVDDDGNYTVVLSVTEDEDSGDEDEEDGTVTVAISSSATVYLYEEGSFISSSIDQLTEADVIYYREDGPIYIVPQTSEAEAEAEAASVTSAVGYVTALEAADDGYTVTLSTADGETTVTIENSRTVYLYSSSSVSESSAADITTGSILFYSSDADVPIYLISVSSSSSSDDSADSGSQQGGSTSNGTSDGTSDGSEDSSSSGSASDGMTADQNDASSMDSGSDASSFGDMTSTGDSTDGTDSIMYGDSTASGDSSMSTDMTSDMTGTTDTSDMTGTDTTGMSDASSSEDGTGTTTTTEEAVSSSYGVSESVLCSITPQDTMTITITIDELDILSISEGQDAQVTLDALPGQSFDGTVTEVNTSGSNNGGNSKYTAVVTIDRNESMLVGMNASVSIVIDTTEDVLTILEDALVEDGTSVYVYTSYDEETGEYGDLVEVTTGVSDGTTVEILSGLEEGDTYYYSYLDTVNYSSTIVSSDTGSLFSSMMSGGGGR